MSYIDCDVETDKGVIPVQIALISAYLRPYSLMYKAMHTDYSERTLTKEISEGKIPSEEKCGHLIVRKLLKGHRGHYGVLEHCPLVFHLKGINPYSLVVFKDMPSVIIREFPRGTEIIYLKCNIRSFLSIMDYWIINGTASETLETGFKLMWELFAEYVPTIAEWYLSERKPLILRKLQPNF